MLKPRTIKTVSSPTCRLHSVDRWTTWARTLQQRHNRMALRYQNPSFVFGRWQSVSLHRIERWHHVTSRLLPLIRLSIGPVFLHYLNKGIRLFAGPGSRFESLKTTNRRFSSTPAKSKLENSEPTISDPHPRPSLEFSTLLHRTRHDFQTLQSHSAFLRVFSRLEENFRWLSSTQFETQLIHSNVQLVNRVINERRRFEDPRRSPVDRQQLKPSPVATNARPVEMTTFESKRTVAATPKGSAHTPALPIDIDRLTDQVVRSIDSRIIAHRERMGKVF